MTEQQNTEQPPSLTEGEKAEIMNSTWHETENAIKSEISNGIRAQLHAEYLAEKEKLRGNHVGLTWLDQKYRNLGLWASFDNDPRLQAETQRRMAEMRTQLVEKTFQNFEQAKEDKRQEQLRSEHEQALRGLRRLQPERRAIEYARIEQNFRDRGLKL
jgi:hypothetical protein